MTEPMGCIIAAVLRGTEPGGIVDMYFRKNKSWEGPFRQRFAEFVRAVASGDPHVDEAASICIEILRKRYLDPRFLSVGELEPVLRATVQVISPRGWWRRPPPPLFGADTGELAVLGEVVRDVLVQVEGRTQYVALTKLLHFCFPCTFPICDQRAATSIKGWGMRPITNQGRDAGRFAQLLVDKNSVQLASIRYQSVTEFYRLFWEASSEDQRQVLVRRAEEIGCEIGGRVTALDLLDKLLWSANGDSQILGF